MGRTGVMFLISGIFLIVFGVYLEKKRRALMKQIKLQTTGAKP
jgi:sulfite exporter TauE/SafE